MYITLYVFSTAGTIISLWDFKQDKLKTSTFKLSIGNKNTIKRSFQTKCISYLMLMEYFTYIRHL